MPSAPDAILEDHEGRSLLRFERVLHSPPGRVWKALTEHDELRSWHPSPFEMEPVVGGAVHYLSPEGTALGDGEVTAYEPPRLLAYTWGDDHLRWELRAHDNGCLLILEHTFDNHYKAARDAAGWHLCLDALSASLTGAMPPAASGEAAILAGWRELNSAYEERFAIPPEKATPPPL
ncbi:MAG: SRPBCC family protein [Nitriliruptorales bacterium]